MSEALPGGHDDPPSHTGGGQRPPPRGLCGRGTPALLRVLSLFLQNRFYLVIKEMQLAVVCLQM